ncbi:Serine aminopeptidase [Parelusimicrobium proximum]|uniref:alpha/beta hydrolase n=1 Tax=Parelusimicrobium proximum TaxID=3228953 RepID=UPI003D1807BF
MFLNSFKKTLIVLSVVCMPLFAYSQDAEEAAPAEPEAIVYADSIETTPLEGSEVSFETDDGVVIKGSFFPAKAPEGERDRYVILLHDLGKNKSSFNKFTSALKSEGIGFLAIDLRGHGKSVNKGHYSKFERTGINNGFNKMIKDVIASVDYLSRRKVAKENIFVLGSQLGANVAAKSMPFLQDIGGFALLTPTTNNRDVLTIQGIRLNKKPVFIAVSSDNKKNFLDASIIRNNAYLTAGADKVTFNTAYDREGIDMLNLYLTDVVIQWVKTPSRPEVKDDSVEEEAEETDADVYTNITDFMPSVL